MQTRIIIIRILSWGNKLNHASPFATGMHERGGFIAIILIHTALKMLFPRILVTNEEYIVVFHHDDSPHPFSISHFPSLTAMIGNYFPLSINFSDQECKISFKFVFFAFNIPTAQYKSKIRV